jgi:hypothetical protein
VQRAVHLFEGAGVAVIRHNVGGIPLARARNLHFNGVRLFTRENLGVVVGVVDLGQFSTRTFQFGVGLRLIQVVQVDGFVSVVVVVRGYGVLLFPLPLWGIPSRIVECNDGT